MLEQNSARKRLRVTGREVVQKVAVIRTDLKIGSSSFLIMACGLHTQRINDDIYPNHGEDKS